MHTCTSSQFPLLLHFAIWQRAEDTEGLRSDLPLPRSRLLLKARHHFSSPHPALHLHSRGKCASQILTPCATVQTANRRDLEGALNYMCMSFATERQDVALNSSGERQTEKETDKEKPKSTQRTEIKEKRMEK
ncbi:hypothetical protein DPX16_20598 [Anabarilius grahami]|uniref:Uncharacterized protein n=1 Tax=Anabarilius grahami TaxID=495550 RepID=A0A3N0YL80_ANAGA|nr:hypothetical protein DPX16_20598 [Anabarilius grahami]